MIQNFIIYTDQNENVKLKVFIKDETIWATQKQMAELFGVDRSVISRHLKNIFETEELDEKVVCANFALTTKHGAIENKTQTKQVKYYNLDAIIAVGYRVNSKRATRFRIWATKVLREFIIKGFVLDDERLKQGKYFEILDSFGKISKQKALQKAHKEYEEFNKYQPIESDFDKFIKKLKKGEK